MHNNQNIHRHRHIEGYCDNIAVKGQVRVGFWLGNCAGYGDAADAETGWNAVSRILVEEMPPQQPQTGSTVSQTKEQVMTSYYYFRCDFASIGGRVNQKET